MLRLIGIVVTIGLADSLNPTTIAPALYLATGERAKGRVAEFTAAVFAVYFLGGAAIAVGAGQLIRPLLPHPRHHIADIVEIAVGVAMLAAAAMLWRHRARLSLRDPPDFDPQGKSSWILGASITAVELPTAFPYFAAIAAIVGSELGPVRDLVLLVLFNICFVSPLLVILWILTFKAERSEQLISAARNFLQHHWPTVLAGLALVAGLFVATLGLTGLAASHSELAQRIHKTLHG
jgi:cytochrome c biogenesis protein CcdA